MRLLPSREQKQVASHVKTCSYCLSELRRLARADLATSSAKQWIPDIARQVIEAVLAPPTTEWAIAARGGKHRQQRYQAGDLEIIVGVEPTANRWCVRGRVIRQGRAADDVIGRPAYLALQDQVITTEQVDETGYFVFEDVSPGKYELWVEHPKADIVVRGLIVGVEAE
jgi:hypothetical protein